MKEAVVLGMTSLVIIFAVFLRSRRSLIRSMRLMSSQIRKMRPNGLNSSINPIMKQHSAPWAQDHIYVLSKATILVQGPGRRNGESSGVCGIVNRRKWLFKSFSIFNFSTSTMRELSGKREINITRLFGRRLSRRATRLATVFRTSYTISRGSITLRVFPLAKARKSLVFACENSLHV